MMAIDKKIIAIAVIAVVLVAGIATAVVLTNNQSSSGYTIVDGSGKEIKISEPVTSIVTVNTNVPKAMKILGLDDYVTGLSFYSAKSDSSNWNAFSPLFKNAKHMSIAPNMTGEEIAELGVKYVVAQIDSMTVSSDKEREYAELGITVVRLDCFGDTMYDDFKTLLRMCLGDKVTTNDAYETYVKTSDAIVKDVLSKVTPDKSKSFLFFMGGKGFYNMNAALSQTTEQIYGVNALNSIKDLDLSGVTNDASKDGLMEQVIALDAKDPIDVLLLRGSGGMTSVKDAASALKFWEGEYGLIKCNEAYKGLNAVNANNVYIFNSNILSGPLSYVGYILIAEATGFDTGYNVAELITEYNKTYGFDEATSGLLFGTSDGCKSFEEIVVS